MGSEMRLFPSRLLLCLAFLCSAAAGSQGSGAPANSSQEAPPIACKIDFLRSYMLKGYRIASVNDTFAVCPGVNATCCNRRDQLYIYHYLNDIFPQQISQMASKRNLLMARLKKLHRRILATDLSFSGPTPRDNFCATAGRQLYTFDFNGFYRTYLKLALEWDGRATERLSKFFCALCDGNNHQYLDPIPKVALDRTFCKNELVANRPHIEFWAKTAMGYLSLLQNVVDCNHYEKSFNLTFYNPAKVAQSADVANCLDYLNEEFDLHCRRACSRMGLAGLTDYMDGDVLFLERTLNIFEKFNFNRETGQFASIKMRKFHQKWKELRTIRFDHLEGKFTDTILNGTNPVDMTVNPVDFLEKQLGIPLPRKLHLMSIDPGSIAAPQPERRMSIVEAIQEDLSNRPPTEYEMSHRMPSNQNSFFMAASLSPKSDSFLNKRLNSIEHFFQNGRRLQGQTPPSSDASQPQPPSATNRTRLRTPKVSIQNADLLAYDSIIIQERRPEEETVLAVFLKPINIDAVEKVLSDKGIKSSGYNLAVYSLEPFVFYQLVYNPPRKDPFVVVVQEIVDTISADFQTDLKEFLDTKVDIAPIDYYLRAFDDSASDIGSRKQRLLRINHSG